MRPGNWDMLMVALSVAHGVLLFTMPSTALVTVGIWWNSNTISHNFIHRPFFRSKAANALFSLWLTVLLGFPQSLWRDRHLAHHAGVGPRLRLSAGLAVQGVVLLALWIALAARAPDFLIWQYTPGWMMGLALCGMHGYYEHARGVTSHYGRLYNTLCFNDGYHVEHHARPGMHWTQLSGVHGSGHVSAWPAPLRWLDGIPIATGLELLERLVLRSAVLQRWVLGTHRRALEAALNGVKPRHVAIVGGGLFPRTAFILRELLPETDLTVFDYNAAHVECARALLPCGDVTFVNARYDGRGDVAFDLVVIPLSYRGDRESLYQRPPAPVLLIHDWIWRRRGYGHVVSMAMLKRINVVRQ
jgi:hypothetical protein